MKHSDNARPRMHVSHRLQMTPTDAFRKGIPARSQTERYVLLELLSPSPMRRIKQDVDEFENVCEIFACRLSECLVRQIVRVVLRREEIENLVLASSQKGSVAYVAWVFGYSSRLNEMLECRRMRRVGRLPSACG